MLPLVYTISPELKQVLPHIDFLRQTLLCIPVSPTRERGMRWDTKVLRIQSSLSLAGISLTPLHIANILTLPTRQTLASTITGYNAVLTVIWDTYSGSGKTVPFTFLQQAAANVYRGQFAAYQREVTRNQAVIRELLTYLDAQAEHPLVAAGVALGMLSASILPQTAPGLLPRLMYWTYLAKRGYDCRGLIVPEEEWATNPAAYHEALTDARTRGNLSSWLQFVASSYRSHLEKRILLLRNQTTLQNLNDFWRLNDRQRAILHLVENPSISITNKTIQNKFKISQITASRDLAKLATLNLLHTHGKGRSVSYTRL